MRGGRGMCAYDGVRSLWLVVELRSMAEGVPVSRPTLLRRRWPALDLMSKSV